MYFFHLPCPREEEEEEQQEELGDFQLLTDDNAFDSEEVGTDGARQLLQHSDLRSFISAPFIYSFFNITINAKCCDLQNKLLKC